MLLPDEKLIYLHVPRTGGTSMSFFFTGRKSSSPHKNSMAHRAQAMAGAYPGYRVFCTVRDPVERLLSIYRCYLKGGNKSSADREVQAFVESLGCARFLDMASCSEGVAELMQRFYHFQVMLQPQSEWVEVGGRRVTDFLVATRDLPGFFALAAERFGIKRAAEHRNQTSDVYGMPTQQAERISRFYAADVVLAQEAIGLKAWRNAL